MNILEYSAEKLTLVSDTKKVRNMRCKEGESILFHTCIIYCRCSQQLYMYMINPEELGMVQR
jgi:hypothetical protein